MVVGERKEHTGKVEMVTLLLVVPYLRNAPTGKVKDRVSEQNAESNSVISPKRARERGSTLNTHRKAREREREREREGESERERLGWVEDEDRVDLYRR